MANPIQTRLPAPSQPFSWATHAGSLMFTAHGAVDSAGQIAGADITAQARLTFDNLVAAVAAAGASMTDVAQVLIYMRDARDMAAIDVVYREYFTAPYPNRASVAVAGFVHPAMLIEVVAYVHILPKPGV
ncbi:RidA family protein [Cupriavidus sp. UYPR2.512]|uniref:RidA family protein n=1 Tax=Cupriavidus sp. UYPR2.512 TaxID=1080187 RepID=UPI000378BB55|nr:RidA family protein [Cupriavidus sp. UYPR2.512]UIF87438.1 RidA family protein [Cupriavidus necator]